MKKLSIILVFLATISANGQDSAMVQDICKTFARSFDGADRAQVLESYDVIKKYLEKNPLPGINPLQEVLRLQYRLSRELTRSCANYPSGQVRMTPTPVFDLENKLVKGK